MPSIELEQYPVAAWQEGGEWHSNGLAFEDYARCHTETHKLARARKLPTPEWAISDSKFREVLVNYLEDRAGIKPWLRTGTLQERMVRAQQRIIAACVHNEKILDRLCAEYVDRKRKARTAEDRKWLRMQERLIENVDSRLRFESKDGGAAFITGCCYFYYRLGLDSVAVGMQLGAKPPHIRQTLWRLAQTWKKLEKWRLEPSSRPLAYSCQRQPRRCGKKPIDEARVLALYQSGMRFPDIAHQLGYPRGIGTMRIRYILRKAGVYPR